MVVRKTLRFVSILRCTMSTNTSEPRARAIFEEAREMRLGGLGLGKVHRQKDAHGSQDRNHQQKGGLHVGTLLGQQHPGGPQARDQGEDAPDVGPEVGGSVDDHDEDEERRRHPEGVPGSSASVDDQGPGYHCCRREHRVSGVTDPREAPGDERRVTEHRVQLEVRTGHQIHTQNPAGDQCDRQQPIERAFDRQCDAGDDRRVDRYQ